VAINANAPEVPAPVKAVFDRYADEVAKKLLELRSLIFSVADDESITALEETLKWGQPAYLCKTGTTIRIDRDDTIGCDIALYVNCKTTLVGEWRERFPEFTFGGTRSLHLRLSDRIDDDRLRMCIADALGYCKRKTRR
jgi:hypothetical protein